jgi:hypothetical protein
VQPGWWHDALPSFDDFRRNLPSVMPIWWPTAAPEWHLFLSRLPSLVAHTISVVHILPSNGGMTTFWSKSPSFRDKFDEMTTKYGAGVDPADIYNFGSGYIAR